MKIKVARCVVSIGIGLSAIALSAPAERGALNQRLDQPMPMTGCAPTGPGSGSTQEPPLPPSPSPSASLAA